MTKHRFKLYHGNATKNRTFTESLGHAIRGLVSALLFEANVRRQALIFLLALTLGFWLKLATIQFAIVLVISVAVLTMELINSSIEAIADAVHPDYNEHIQRAKDMAAGAVLIVSCAAAVLGLAIFLPPILKMLV